MLTNVKTPTLLLALIAATALFASATTGALADTGGAAAAPAESTSSTPAKIGPSGIATWFGPGFYGKQTACGQTLTPAVVGVANRTLPCGTLVSVSYRGHSLTVPVLDRGPYGHHANWDLTAGAAESLGITETVRIATHIVGKTTNSPSLGLPPGSAGGALAGGALAG
ncbi:MAG TPA: septal ring lytic transglycosylase RlpA family protein [Solirubrobacteraceae bacterium]